MKNVIMMIALVGLLNLVISAQVTNAPVLTLEAAKKIAGEATNFAKSQNAPGGSIAIVDAGGNLIYLERLDNTFPASAMVAYEKANTAATFRAPSKKLEDAINNGRTALTTVGHTFLQGGIPIYYNGVVIGAIGVSGASSAQQDEEIATAGSKANIGQTTN